MSKVQRPRRVIRTYCADGEDVKISGHVLTDDKFSADYDQDGVKATLITTSKDGYLYEGFYEFRDGFRGKCNLRRYECEDETTLMAGDYYEDSLVYKWFIWIDHVM